MKKYILRILTASMAAMLLVATLAGCNKQEPVASSSAPAPVASDDGNTDNTDMPYAGTVLKYAVSETGAQGEEQLALVEMVREKTGIEIEFEIVPNTNAGEMDRTLLMLQSGGNGLDIVYNSTPKLKTFYSAGVLEPLDAMAAAEGYDMQGIYGTNLPVFDDGKAYGLPAFNDIWITLYNKQIFDDANVPYPSADNWTWEEYIKVAEQLSRPQDDVWGSFMLDYDCYNYMYATQKGAEPYKADGTANFDDPLYAEAMEFFYSLGNDYKIQPDSMMYKSGDYPWNGFVALGQMGMFVCGGWTATMLPNLEQYPRDWEAGILPMPYPEGEDPSTIVVTGCYGIPVTSENKEAAYEAIKCIAENQYLLGYGRVPARVDLTEQEKLAYIEETMVPTFANDGITAKDILEAWFNADRLLYSEKIVGPADTAINQIFIEEGQLYGQGAKTLPDTMESIQNRANNAIEDENY